MIKARQACVCSMPFKGLRSAVPFPSRTVPCSHDVQSTVAAAPVAQPAAQPSCTVHAKKLLAAGAQFTDVYAMLLTPLLVEGVPAAPPL